MSAIRPLATIAMLMALGYILWTRINTPGLEATAEGELASSAELPPLEFDPGMAGDMGATPPPFNPAGPTDAAEEPGEFAFGPTSEPPANNTITPLSPADTAGMPDLPPLPDSVPQANYPDTASTEGTVTGSVPELGTQVPAAPPADTMADAGNDSLPADSAPLTPDVPDLPMGAGEEFAAEPSAFGAARPAIAQALESGDLERAHLLLSGWYGDRSLTATERDEVEQLLSQLAGSVVYSQDHRLEPPHTVAAGETLETIAQKYNVPWQLLAKINGVSNPSAVTPGQELKVIRGPFSAVVDVERQQLALMVADRYAGRFSVKTEGQAASDGEWVVKQKQMPSAYGAASKQMVLEATGGTSLVIAPPSDTAEPSAGAIRIGEADQNDLFDILSVGSRVIIRK